MGRWVSLANASFKLAHLGPVALRDSILRVARSGLPGSVCLNFGDGILVAARGDA